MISQLNGVTIHAYHTLVKVMLLQLIVMVLFSVVAKKFLNVSAIVKIFKIYCSLLLKTIFHLIFQIRLSFYLHLFI